MSSAGFEPSIPVIKRRQTLDRKAIGIGNNNNNNYKFIKKERKKERRKKNFYLLSSLFRDVAWH
jgi:hypothetical protein